MKLHKWSSNSDQLWNSSSSSDVEHSFSIDNDLSVKALGIIWKPFEEKFVYKVSTAVKSSYTKREVLSVIAKLYDPLGFLAPVLTRVKILLQRLWLQKLDWDEVLPNPISDYWNDFVTNLKCIDDAKIDKFIPSDEFQRIVLQGFADASEAAYGAVVYLQCFTSTHSAKVTIIANKSRISPIRVISIPRLELCACVLLAQLVQKLRASLRLEISETVLHTDSTIALACLNTPANHLKTFIANRVSKVQTLTENCHWANVPSSLNPADLVSRGLSPRDIHNQKIWWNGPPFLEQGELSNEQTSSPLTNEYDYSCEELNSERKTLTMTLDNNLLNKILSLHNNFHKIVCVLSYLYRFIENCRNPLYKQVGPLKICEIQRAETTLFRLVQQVEFYSEVKDMSSKGMVNPKSKIKIFSPFLDTEGVLRVGGRLVHSNLSFDKKNTRCFFLTIID
ncbi:uncharacterized protein [Parasteatoda tepidariorum]|uniref:uncharacterized protein n=1 Tax=Parasteatoda tepidariorum TaxID=114398 RepID=UPI001C71A0C3|nr:uncharacterized protein LOC122270555 [Parasteatoda tepidariorum]